MAVETPEWSCSHVGVMPGRSVVKEGLKFPRGGCRRQWKKRPKYKKGLERGPGMR